ncbi:hypothetical protein BST83_12320 [Polaribacter filamentus]|uniref:Pesticidal crystal protein Cry22Aa Ig-like domain-containing protein n=1 Tax=Polaribacter filamentus TaxID=53483 RepID=A0A2S7KZ08_9FLAO|nr:immunoglobulin-like domain-containing protein [Polaribacter filamentus]PQB07850.1 hypothetical protein BST83_12320 [Polaribacter filamentus]
MKKLYIILAALLVTASTFAQAPEKMSYQAVVRDSGDALVTSQPVGMQISILQNTPVGTAVYVETQTPTTNVNGLVTLEIGTGTVVSGDFTTIDWSADSYFIKTETDPAGGTNYTIIGTSQLMSVPFALYAKTSESSETNAITIANNTTAIAINTAKVGYTEALVSANTDVVANTAKVGYTEALVSANTDVAANTSKVGYTEALVSANTDVAANTSKVGYTEALVSANTDVVANTAKVGYTEALVSANTDVVANTAKVGMPAGTAIGQMNYWNGTTWQTINPGNSGEVLQMVSGIPVWGFIDTTAPVITVTPGTDTVEQGSTWTDAGATADGGETVSVSGTVDINTVGTYTITYTATDASGNVGTAERTVTVVDTTAPVITVTPGTDTVEQGSTWTDAGATSDGGETVSVSGTVDINTVGTYTITYTATDASGNVGTAERTVTVNPPPAIGDFHQGGYIFYLDGNGGGLIAAPTDQSNAPWGCYGNTITGADGTAIGTGAQNTIDIELGCTTAGTAADICANLTLGGYSDWFLPSKDELNLMYLKIGQGNTSTSGNVGGFVDNYYWSSTEYDYYSAWNQSFTNGSQGYINKYNPYNSVRAVRAF